MTRVLSAVTIGVLAASMTIAAEPSTTGATSFSPREVLKQLSSEAAEARRAANEIATLARDRRADLSPVSGQIAEIERRAARINELVQQLEGSREMVLPPAEMERLKQLAQLLNIFIDNKKSTAADGLEARDRTALRNHALGVATRADMIQKTAARSRG